MAPAGVRAGPLWKGVIAMLCPNCSATMDEVTVSGVRIDYCRTGCQGVFFDNHELKRMDEMHEAAGDPVLSELLAHERGSDERSDRLSCPRCAGMKMRRVGFAYGSGINIDRCYGCNGVWLDKGELAAIRANYKSPEERLRNADHIIQANPEIAVNYAEAKAEQGRIHSMTKSELVDDHAIGSISRFLGRLF